jgi:hypothetical protein
MSAVAAMLAMLAPWNPRALKHACAAARMRSRCAAARASRFDGTSS